MERVPERNIFSRQWSTDIPGTLSSRRAYIQQADSLN